MFNHDLEDRLKDKVLLHLESGREGWDLPHTILSVKRMKELIASEGGDEKVLVSTMYLHDTGYTLLRRGFSLDENNQIKVGHCERSVVIAKDILNELGEYTEDEIKEIVYLVEHHDDYSALDSHNRQLVFEADNLAKIDVDFIVPPMGEGEYLRFLNLYKEVRAPLFQTETGKGLLQELMPQVDEYINKR